MKNNIFKNGSKWIRADFHLHTKSDKKEFEYNGEENSFVNDYIEKLKSSEIQLGVITNHNKFNFEEFKVLKRKAKTEEILLLPGVELSVNDGANGIHTLIVFSEEWVADGKDYISPFISTMFPGKATSEYQNENGRSDKNILQVVEELEKTSRDYFLIFAHVEQDKGLWVEMKGGKISDFISDRYATVRKRTLGFQKVRTRDDREKVEEWLGDWYPAEVEGSDCKSIEEIGQGGKCWIKLGYFSYEAVKFALMDKKDRITKKEPIKHSHSYIKKIEFEGGILDGQTIEFSPELNSFIGIRGSGKSSILEAIRYTLNIPFGEKTIDIKYKESLVAHTLGSGGKIILTALDQYGQEYKITRILNQQSSEVFIDDKLQPGLSIRETIINKPIYFGQKDLSSSGEGFEKDLVEKLVGEKLYNIRQEIENQNQKVSDAVEKLVKLSNVEEKINEYTQKKGDAEYRLKIFKANGIDKKLKKQTDFNKDEKKIKQIIDYTKSYLNDINELISRNEDDLINNSLYESKQNAEYFKVFFEKYSLVLASLEKIKLESKNIKKLYEKLKDKESEFSKIKKSGEEEFAEVRRTLEKELKATEKSLDLEIFPKLQNVVETSNKMIEVLGKQKTEKTLFKDNLIQATSKLNELWREEFLLIKSELEKINSNHSSLNINIEFKEDKTCFLDFTRNMFRGSKIRETTLSNIVNKYPDFIDIYRNLEEVKNTISNTEKFDEYFINNLKTLLTWQPPNKFIIKYKEKELQHHSLGQRASALIIFVLSQQENDLIIIDQPEDDLDNQTIYEDVIRLIKQLKSKMQFVFATHNANIPVLGDSEQIHSCNYLDEKIEIETGNIDTPILQKEIVSIMEGGEAAFNKRKEIYQSWKLQK